MRLVNKLFDITPYFFTCFNQFEYLELKVLIRIKITWIRK